MFGLDAPRRRQARSLFAGDADASALICPTSYAGLDVLPSDGSLRELDSLLQRLGQRQRLATMAKQVMRAAMLVIVPLPPSPLSVRAFDHVVGEIRRRTLHRQALEANPDWPAIPLLSAREQCAVQHRPVGTFAPHSPAAHAFARLWDGIDRKLAQRAMIEA